MTIKPSSELAARLRARARQEGQDPDTIVEVLLSAALDWEAQERREAIAGIHRGLEAGATGRVRPASEVFAEMRAKLAHASG
jgi:predicted transcriptional regulator